METTTKPRPNLNTIDLTPVIDKIIKEVYQWLNDDSSTLEEVRQDLKTVISYGIHSDGYELAKELESRCGYSSDSELVSILDRVYFLLSNALKAETKEWISLNNISPKLSIGENVKFNERGKTYSGEIIKIYDDAKYSVFVPELGHVREGVGTHGIIIPFEDLEKENSVDI